LKRKELIIYIFRFVASYDMTSSADFITMTLDLRLGMFMCKFLFKNTFAA